MTAHPVMDLENHRWSAVIDNDFAALDELTHPDLTYLNAASCGSHGPESGLVARGGVDDAVASGLRLRAAPPRKTQPKSGPGPCRRRYHQGLRD